MPPAAMEETKAEEETKASMLEEPLSPGPMSPKRAELGPDLLEEELMREAELKTDQIDMSVYTEMDFEGSTNVSEEEEEEEEEEEIGGDSSEEEADVQYVDPMPIMYATEDRARKIVQFVNSRGVCVYVSTMDAYVNGLGEMIDNSDRVKELVFSRALDHIHEHDVKAAMEDIRLLDPQEKLDDPEKEKERITRLCSPIYSGAAQEVHRQYKFYQEQAKEERLKSEAKEMGLTLDEYKLTLPVPDPEEEGAEEKDEMDELPEPEILEFDIAAQETGEGTIPIKLLTRLQDSFNNCAAEDKQGFPGLWFEDFAKAVAMMGKAFDAAALRKHFQTCNKLQSKFDEIGIKFITDDPEALGLSNSGDEQPMGFCRDVTDDLYEPRLRDLTVVDEEAGEVNLPKSRHRIRALINEAFEMQESNVLPEKSEEDEARCVGFLDLFSTSEEDDQPKAKAAADSESRSVYVALPTGVLATVPRFRTVPQMKAYLRVKYGIPDAHIILKGPDGARVGDHASTEQIAYLTLERPISRSVWIQFFVDHLVQDVDEDEVLKHWRNICQLTRENREKNGEGGAPFDPHEDPTRMFCYATDLRKVMTGFGDKMSDEEADIFIRECRPMTTKELFEAERDNADEFGQGLMPHEEFIKPENKYDMHARIYHEQYYSALTDDTL